LQRNLNAAKELRAKKLLAWAYHWKPEFKTSDRKRRFANEGCSKQPLLFQADDKQSSEAHPFSRVRIRIVSGSGCWGLENRYGAFARDAAEDVTSSPTKSK
jgi:hypothetical protein